MVYILSKVQQHAWWLHSVNCLRSLWTRVIRVHTEVAKTWICIYDIYIYMRYIYIYVYIYHRYPLTAAYARIFSMSTVFYFPPITWAIPQGPLLSCTLDIIHEDGSSAGSKMSVSYRCSAVISKHSAGHCSISVVPRVITNCPPNYNTKRWIIIASWASIH